MADQSNPMDQLLKIMASLRDPDTGCPWDQKQSYETIIPYTLEEAHEVAEAIAQKDMDALKEELGDLLFQVVFYAQMAKEEKAFDFNEIVEAINAKMVRRHPHVFGTDEEKAAVVMEGLWDRIKAEESAARSSRSSKSSKSSKSSSSNLDKSVLDNVPLSLPALSRAIKLQNKAAKVGFDWPDINPVFDKMQEEMSELQTEIEAHNKEPSDEALSRIEDEFGDLLFVMANVGRHLKIDPEQALMRTNRKFVKRFSYIEQKLAQQERTPEEASLEEMEAIWVEAKKR